MQAGSVCAQSRCGPFLEVPVDAKTKASPSGPENSTYDIFKKLPDGSSVRVATIMGLERAKKLIRLASGSGDFAIYNPATGEFVEPFKKSA
jgi:hypothetical protein